MPALRMRCVAISLLLVAAFALPATAQSYRSIPMADGFDYPVGKPDAKGYYKRRGFYPNAHMGEDWNGNGGGNTDLGDPVYATGNGLCVYSKAYGSSWGDIVILRHAYREKNGRIYYVDSLYAHLAKRTISEGELAERGEVIGTIGTANGLYVAHLHFEIRKNLAIGPWQSSHSKTYSNYHSPTHFIDANRRLRAEFRRFQVPVDTFSKTRTDARNYANAPAASTGSSGRVQIQVRQPSKSVPAPVREVIDKQSADAEKDKRSFWQKFKGTFGFGKKKEE